MIRPVPKTLLFDIGKVLVPFDFIHAYEAMRALTGLEVAEIRSRLAATTLFRDFETGLIEPEPFAAEVMRLIGFECDLPAFAKIWTSIFARETLIPEGFVASLRERYRLLVVSNTNVLHFEMLHREYPIFRHFDDYVLSYKVHAMKPAAAFYDAALSMAECEPGEGVFIDDLLENVEGARKAGFDGIHFQSHAQLTKEFEMRGIA
jgi:putative hydrolase of the HAD superfamily